MEAVPPARAPTACGEQEFQAAHFLGTAGCCPKTQRSPYKAEQRETAQLRAGRAHGAPSASRIGRAAEDTGAKSLRTMGNLPRVKDPWSAAGWSRTGLQHHQPIVHLSQKLWVYAFSNVIDLVWVCSQVVDFYEHL